MAITDENTISVYPALQNWRLKDFRTVHKVYQKIRRYAEYTNAGRKLSNGYHVKINNFGDVTPGPLFNLDNVSIDSIWETLVRRADQPISERS